MLSVANYFFKALPKLKVVGPSVPRMFVLKNSAQGKYSLANTQVDENNC
jgi:hypothetical protein